MRDLPISVVLIAEEDDSLAMASNIRAVREALRGRGGPSELVLVHSGSGSRQALDEAQTLWPGCQIIRYEHRQPYGVGLKQGIRRSTLPYILCAGASAEVAVESIRLMLEAAPNADMVIGRRGGARAGLRETVYAWMWSKIATLLFGVDAGDVDCPFKLIRRSTLERIGFLESRGEIFNTELLALMVGSGARVLESPMQVVRPVGRRFGRVGFTTTLWLLLQLGRLWGRVRRLHGLHEAETRFHDRWAQSIDVDSIDVPAQFEAVTAAENRCAFEQMGDIRGKRILDLGCGAGEASVYFALHGAKVTAVDISPEMIQVVRRLAQRYGVDVDAKTMLAENLGFDDQTFDAVFGNGVLHHTYRPAAYAEIHRVLKPGGIGLFVEPLPYNPLLWVYRRLAGAVRTEGERPFSLRDFRLLRHVFVEVSHREFWLLSMAVFLRMFFIERLHPGKVRYWKHIITHAAAYERAYRRLRRLDDGLLSAAPFLGALAWNTVIVVKKA